jgi:hypothetical protein
MNDGFPGLLTNKSEANRNAANRFMERDAFFDWLSRPEESLFHCGLGIEAILVEGFTRIK